MWKLRDAVITPMDQCYFANQDNGYGESVHNDSKYLHYDEWWGPKGATQITPRPNGLGEPHLGVPNKPFDPNDISYTGNYIWERKRWSEICFYYCNKTSIRIWKTRTLSNLGSFFRTARRMETSWTILYRWVVTSTSV